MKAIMINTEKVISLENIKSISLQEGYTGTKAHLSNYWVAVIYMNGEDEITPYASCKQVAIDWLQSMYKIITAD